MSQADGRRQGPLPHASPAESGGGRTVLYALALLVFLGAVVHPVRHYLVEPWRQRVLGNREPAARRLALASQFGFTTAAGSHIRLVPGQAETDLRDLPTQAVTLILGGFRGPYVIWLWMSVEDEKTKRIHFDLIDRYTKIEALQADYPAVVVFNIDNIAYNVSVQFQSLDVRYKWIRVAAEYGSEGFRRNPNNAEIMAEIGRVYSEKLGRSQEAAYYRKRVKEDEGRSTFLLAYEWYDRARRANDQENTLVHGGLTKQVIYSQAPHSLRYYATETTLEGYDLLKESMDLRRAGREPAAREAYDHGLKKIREAVPQWEWARREWRAHVVRFENAGIAPDLINNWRRFYNEADAAVQELREFQAELTYDNLPLCLAAKATAGAYAAVIESSQYAGQRETERLARETLNRGLARWDEAVTAWEAALAFWDAHIADLEKRGGSADALRAAKDMRAKAAAQIAYLKETRKTLSLETVPSVAKTLHPLPAFWPMPDLSLQ